MGGFSNDGADDVMYADNVDFSGNTPETKSVTLNGQLLIGSTAAPNIRVGNLTSPLSTITIGYSSPNITLDIAGGAAAVEHLTCTTGGQLNPTANNFNLLAGTVAAGTTPVAIAGSGSTLTTNIQISQALAAADATKIGLSNFSSASFAVAATGFVTLVGSVTQLFTANTGTATPSSNNLNVLGGGGIQTAGSGATLTIAVSGGGAIWNNVTGTSATMAKENGYQANNAGLVTLTMPSVASSTFGDTIKIAGFGSGGWLIQCVATQLIHFGSTATSAAGSIASTNRYDQIELVCSSTTTEWFVRYSVGNLTTA